MPYTIEKNDNEYCVYKKGTDGGAVGDTLGCHDTEGEAIAQIGAIESAESSRFVIRVSPQGIIEAPLMLWGSPNERDAYGTWADKNNPPEFGLDTLPFRLMYEHGGDPEIGRDTIGRVTDVWVDEDGFRFRAQLDKAGKWFKRVVKEIGDGILKVSSASADHLASIDDWGRFRDWLISEVSLTADPAEPRMTSVSLIRSIVDSRADAVEGTREACDGCIRSDSETHTHSNEVKQKMTLDEMVDQLLADYSIEEIMAVLNSRNAAPEAPPPTIDEMRSALNARKAEADAVALRARLDALENAQKEQAVQRQAQQPDPAPVPSNSGSTVHGTRISNVGSSRRYLDGRSTSELVQAYMIMRSRVPDHVRDIPGVKIASDEMMRAMADQILLEEERGNASARYAARELRSNLGGRVTRADIMGTDVTGYGAEWVGTYYDNDLWEEVRTATIYQELLRKGLREKMVPRGYASEVIPLEGSDPTWYLVPEANQVDATGYPKVEVPVSKPGTGNKSVTVKKFGALTYISRESTEDMVVDIAAETRRQFVTSAQEQMEYLIINGDTETAASTNINLIDGTPGATSSYLGFNGFLKAPLVTNTANSHGAGATLDEKDYLILQTYLGSNGIAANDPDKLVYMIDVPTKIASLNIPAWKTADVVRNATIESGRLVQAWGVDVLVSGQMALANTAGKISGTASNNTKGRILLLRPDQWHVGIKRQIDVRQEDHIISDTIATVAYFRMGMVYRAVDSAAAVAYNVDVSIS